MSPLFVCAFCEFTQLALALSQKYFFLLLLNLARNSYSFCVIFSPLPDLFLALNDYLLVVE